MSEVTQILEAIESGDIKAVDQLFPLVYQELHQLAAQRLRKEPAGQTLQATALVHEAYLRLVGSENQQWYGSRHFFSAAAEAIRRILVENARRKKRLKYGGGRKRVDYNDEDLSVEGPSDDIIVVDEALAKFAIEDPKKAELVKLRYFGGLSVEQAAEILEISRATADRYWSYARAWLFHEITKSNDAGSK